MSWHISPWFYPVWDSLWLLNLTDYFLFHVGEIFKYNLLKKFIIPFVFLFLFWDPYSSNVGALDIVPEVSETILSTFHSFYFILLFRSHFQHFIFQLTDVFFCFRYSAIDSFHRIFDFSNCVVSVCLFFSSSRFFNSILAFSPFCFQGFWYLFYHYSESFFRFAYFLFIYLDFCF